MKAFFLLPFVFLYVDAYSGGGPRSTCRSLRPGHGHTPSGMPYRVEVTDNTYTPGMTVTVCIRGENFEGLMLQARNHDSSSTTPYGKFSQLPSNTKRISCSKSDDTVTQSSTTEKPDNTCFVWTPPDENVGRISFIATVCRSFGEYWLGLRSGAMTYLPLTTTAATTTTAPTTTTTTPASTTTTVAPATTTTRAVTTDTAGPTTMNAATTSTAGPTTRAATISTAGPTTTTTTTTSAATTSTAGPASTRAATTSTVSPTTTNAATTTTASPTTTTAGPTTTTTATTTTATYTTRRNWRDSDSSESQDSSEGSDSLSSKRRRKSRRDESSEEDSASSDDSNSSNVRGAYRRWRRRHRRAIF